MLQPIVDRFIECKPQITDSYRESLKHGDLTYKELLLSALKVMYTDDDYDVPCWERVTEIDYGDYQGTKLFVVAAWGYQPSLHFITHNYYGSCSGCDSLQAATGCVYWGDDTDEEQRNILNTAVNDCYTLALHMFQRMTEYNAC